MVPGRDRTGLIVRIGSPCLAGYLVRGGSQQGGCIFLVAVIGISLALAINAQVVEHLLRLLQGIPALENTAEIEKVGIRYSVFHRFPVPEHVSRIVLKDQFPAIGSDRFQAQSSGECGREHEKTISPDMLATLLAGT